MVRNIYAWGMPHARRRSSSRKRPTTDYLNGAEILLQFQVIGPYFESKIKRLTLFFPSAILLPEPIDTDMHVSCMNFRTVLRYLGWFVTSPGSYPQAF